MNRRAFVTGLGAVLAAPLGAEAQRAGKVPRIGWLGGPTRESAEPFVEEFQRGLKDLGWVEGQNERAGEHRHWLAPISREPKLDCVGALGGPNSTIGDGHAPEESQEDRAQARRFQKEAEEAPSARRRASSLKDDRAGARSRSERGRP